MKIERRYTIASNDAIYALEDLADSFLIPRYKKEVTVKGTTEGKSRDSIRQLIKGTDALFALNHSSGMNNGVPVRLLRGAKLIKRGRPCHVYSRFGLDKLVGNNLQEGETLAAVLKSYDVFGRDDYFWFFQLGYQNEELYIRIGDNTTWTYPDEKFQQFYARLFGNIFDRYVKRQS
mgnify:CR=1 FL=1